MRQLIFSFVIFIVCASHLFADEHNAEILFQKLQPLADSNNPEAQYHLGMMYNNGLGTDADYEKAMTLFRESAALGDPLGAYKLGCYYDGQYQTSLAVDREKAFQFKLYAATKGYALAQNDVAIYYAEDGDWKNAFRWWKAAADQGFSSSLKNIGAAYWSGYGTETNKPAGYAYFLLWQRAKGKKLSPDAVASLTELKAQMTESQFAEANAIALDWQAVPTELTLKARQGLNAAAAMIQ